MVGYVLIALEVAVIDFAAGRRFAFQLATAARWAPDEDDVTSPARRTQRMLQRLQARARDCHRIGEARRHALQFAADLIVDVRAFGADGLDRRMVGQIARFQISLASRVVGVARARNVFNASELKAPLQWFPAARWRREALACVDCAPRLLGQIGLRLQRLALCRLPNAVHLAASPASTFKPDSARNCSAALSFSCTSSRNSANRRDSHEFAC